jgi:hypothetical protein
LDPWAKQIWRRGRGWVVESSIFLGNFPVGQKSISVWKVANIKFSLSLSLGRHLLSLPIIALFFVQLTPSIELARDYGRLIKHCIMAMENRPIIDEFPIEILKLPFMGDFPVDKSCNPCIIHYPFSSDV